MLIHCRKREEGSDQIEQIDEWARVGLQGWLTWSLVSHGGRWEPYAEGNGSQIRGVTDLWLL